VRSPAWGDEYFALTQLGTRFDLRGDAGIAWHGSCRCRICALAISVPRTVCGAAQPLRVSNPHANAHIAPERKYCATAHTVPAQLLHRQEACQQTLHLGATLQGPCRADFASISPGSWHGKCEYFRTYSYYFQPNPLNTRNYYLQSWPKMINTNDFARVFMLHPRQKRQCILARDDLDTGFQHCYYM
jgi:hypothetical protein